MLPTIGLDRLQPGQTATVKGLAVQGSMRRRLQDMGLIEGTSVECVAVSPLGDPAAYLIRGAVVALRSKDAAGVSLSGAGTPVPFACEAASARLCPPAVK